MAAQNELRYVSTHLVWDELNVDRRRVPLDEPYIHISLATDSGLERAVKMSPDSAVGMARDLLDAVLALQ